MSALLVLAHVPAARARPADVTVLPSGASTIHFVVAVPEPDLTAHPQDGSLLRIGLPGYSLEGAPGTPALPVRVVSVAVPPTGAVRLSARADGASTREGITLAPAELDQDGAPAGPPRRLADAYARSGPTLPARARLLGVGWMRDQRVARIAIEPFDYDAAARRLSAVRQVDVTLDLEGATALVPGAPGDGAFEAVYREALINPEQGRPWRRARQDLTTGATRAAMPAARIVPGDTVFASHHWVKIAISDAGFYKVQYSQLRNLTLFHGDSVAIDSLRLFTWPGFPVVSEFSYCDTCGYREVAMQIVLSADHQVFSRNDEYFYFYALGSSGWSNLFDPTLADTLYLEHPYETQSYLYLTIATADEPIGGAPKRITNSSSPPTGTATVPITFPQRVHYEQDLEYYPQAAPILSRRPDLFWQKWFWRTLDVGKQFQVTGPDPDAPGADSTQPYRFRARVYGLSANDPCSYTGLRPPQHQLDTQVNGQSLPLLAWARWSDYTTLARIVDTVLTDLHPHNSILFSVPVTSCASRQDLVGIAWVELYYRRRFQAMANALAFESEPGGGHWEYHVGDFTGPTPPHVFDVTDPLAPVEVLGATYVHASAPDTTFTLAFERTESSQHRYAILPDTSIVRVPSASVTDAFVPSLSVLDLGSPQQGADVVIIYYDAFKTAADQLAAWRSTHLPAPDTARTFEVITVPVSALYDQFSGGRTDPGALRSFLRAAYYNWQKRPRWVTLLGDASYDFKNLLGLAPAGRPGSLVPTYENGFDVSLQRQFSTDDWIFNVDSAATVIPDYFGGRIPAPDLASANAYVQKLIAYESTAPYGTWRNRVLLVADDDTKGDSPDVILWGHVRQTSVLDTTATPDHLDRRYVYLHKYPLGPGATRPGARDAIFQDVDEGTQIFNFVGHGSAFKITDEGVFLYSDPGSLKNPDMPTVFVSASCDVGKFDDPELQGLGERLALNATGGAIGVVSATEEAISGENSDLNINLFRSCFSRDTLGGSGQYTVGFSEALLAAKIGVGGTINAEKYQLMGDAGVRLDLPRDWVVVTLLDSAGVTPVTDIARGQTLTFRGEVRTSPASSAALVPLEGTADVLIEDAQTYEQAPLCRLATQSACTDRPYYYYYAGAMFRGDVSVHGGRFEGRFVAPLEAHAGVRSRARAYVQGHVGGATATTDGVGSVFTNVVPGTAGLADTQGPRISLSFAGGSTSVRRDAVLHVDLSDPSGILTTAHTPQNGIVVTIDDNTTTRVDITSSFRYAADSYTNGSATYQLPNLSSGTHSIKVSAADNLAIGLSAGLHRSVAELAFSVLDTPPLKVARAYLFPDPTSSGGPRGGGTFVIDAPGDSINVMMRMYTVSGRLIRTLKAPGGLGQVQIPWDGLDAEGDRLANGVYLFKAFVYARESNGDSSPLQHAIGEGRFVIVNR